MGFNLFICIYRSVIIPSLIDIEYTRFNLIDFLIAPSILFLKHPVRRIISITTIILVKERSGYEQQKDMVVDA